MKMSTQSFTGLLGIGSKSEDLRGVRSTRQRTSSAVTQLRFCKAFLVSGGFNTRECESEGKTMTLGLHSSKMNAILHFLGKELIDNHS